MQFLPLKLSGVFLITPQIFGDERGFFFESFQQDKFARATGFRGTFVQDNHSKSSHGTLRGLHYQINPKPQGKLVRATTGKIFDVAVDLRKNSPTFGGWAGAELSAENKKQLWIPAGFAHGFLVLSREAEVLYKATDFWSPEHERALRWDDPTLGIEWPINASETPFCLSDKDQKAPLLSEAKDFF